MVIEINKDIDRYQESVAMGLTAKQLIFSIASVIVGGGIVLLLYKYIGLTGSIPSMTAHGPPPLKLTGDCPSIAKTNDIWLFQKPNTASRRASILSPSLKISIPVIHLSPAVMLQLPL